MSATPTYSAIFAALAWMSATAVAAPEAEPARLVLPVAADGMTADAAARRAAQVAPEVLQARLQIAQSATEAKVAAAAFAPRVDLRASYTRLGEVDQQLFEFGGVELELAPQILNNYQLRGSITFPVSDYFLTIGPGYKASKKGAEVATYQMYAQREGAAFTARQYYYSYARALAATQVSKTAVEQLEAHVGDLEALVKAGTTTRGDLMQAQAQLANARVQLSSAQGQVQTLGDQLRIYLDLERDASLALGEDVLGAPLALEMNAQSLEERALRARPEVLAMRTLIEANQLNVKMQNGRKYPSVAITGAYDYNNPNSRVFPQEEKFMGSWSAGVVVSWSPNDAFTRSADVGRAELAVTRAQTDLVEIQRRIRNEASQAASNLRVAQEQIAAAEQGVLAAREAWRVQRDLLSAGEATEQQVLDAQAALTRAEHSLVDAQIAARVAVAHADYVVGRATPQ